MRRRVGKTHFPIEMEVGFGEAGFEFLLTFGTIKTRWCYLCF